MGRPIVSSSTLSHLVTAAPKLTTENLVSEGPEKNERWVLGLVVFNEDTHAKEATSSTNLPHFNALKFEGFVPDSANLDA
jgi:hypothetical protein